jgi:hypothetical protein
MRICPFMREVETRERPRLTNPAGNTNDYFTVCRSVKTDWVQALHTVGSGEIEAAVQHNETDAVSDAVLRVVPVASKYNVGIAVIRRSRVNGRTPPDAVLHDDVTEVYQIVEGKGVLVTGGALQSDPLRVLALRSKTH